jgi:hypothetical protein
MRSKRSSFADLMQISEVNPLDDVVYLCGKLVEFANYNTDIDKTFMELSREIER